MEFRLLGPVEVVDGGRALGLGGRRQRAVLAHLLLADGAPVSSDTLIERVWADDAPSAVRASLHTYVSRLRTTLGPGRMEKRSAGYVLHAGREEVDATRFERHLALARGQAADDPRAAAGAYDDALALSRGPALGDLADEPSLRAQARRWDGLVDAARRDRIVVGLQLGRQEALVPELEAMLQADPLGEDLWGHYVLALYRCGRQADALAALSRARTTLRVELGIEPSPRLRRLHEQVLRQDPALTLAGAALRGYRLLGVLGEGASAVVHRAVQPDTGRDVALKSLHPWLADDPEIVRRFAAEAQRALRLASERRPLARPLARAWWRLPGDASPARGQPGRAARAGTAGDEHRRAPRGAGGRRAVRDAGRRGRPAPPARGRAARRARQRLPLLLLPGPPARPVRGAVLPCVRHDQPRRRGPGRAPAAGRPRPPAGRTARRRRGRGVRRGRGLRRGAGALRGVAGRPRADHAHAAFASGAAAGTQPVQGAACLRGG